jgi:ABC-type oligopeptide transport system substrate-binding subunit
MRKPTLSFSTIAILMILTTLLAACQPKATETTEPEAGEGSPTEESSVSPQPGDPLAISADLLLDPAITEDADSLLISSYLYEGLVRLDEAGNVQPGIAQSWVISDDQLDYIFEIRSDARFSDGNPITTDMIVNNFNRWFDPASPLHGGGNYPLWLERFLAFNGERDSENRAVSQFDGIQKVDRNTVIIHLNRPEPNLLSYLALPPFAILNTDLLASGNYGTIATTILSSGPYVILNWTETGLTLSPNPNYWNPVEGDLNFVWK